jgi:hypothetical protein
MRYNPILGSMNPKTEKDEETKGKKCGKWQVRMGMV